MNWWKTLYDHNLAEILLVRADPHETTRTILFLENVLQLQPGCRIFDQCCGIGTLSIALAETKYRVVGVDQCDAYIARAKRDAQAISADLDFFAGDAFEFVPGQPMHAAFNWWTSFGYAHDDAINARMLARAFESLVDGGRFALDFMNVTGLFRHFQRDTILRRSTPQGELLLTRESKLDLARGVLLKEWTYFLANGERVSHSSEVRLYQPVDLQRMLESVGFCNVRFYGDIEAGPLTIDSPRCIAVAQKGEGN